MTDFAPDTEETAAAIAPFVYERRATDDPEHRAQVAKLGKKWRRRKWRRNLLGWLPSGANLPRVLRGRRDQDYVRDSYSETWSAQDWPRAAGTPAPKELSLAVWNGEGLKVRRGGLARGHMPAIAAAFDLLKPTTVLEVGTGMGLNLFTLSARFPDVAWTGIELTEAGVARAQSVQKEPTLPPVIADYFPWPVSDPAAYQRIDFRQGDATRLPFDDNAFDLVFTRQALEQMESVRDGALAEISRVAKTHVILLEPFADFNQSALNKNFVRAKDYFSLPVADLARFGITPLHTYDNFPQKLTLGQGLVVGKVG
ncbi:MAG: class I SAM-dependent methyltransferase [Rhodospirillales bacterium]|nr:class I SAM-dependent methyltransferase [Rhodospirillales bacterium]